MTDKTKNLFNLLMRVTVSAALLFYIFSRIDRERTAEVLRSANLTYIVYALVVFCIIYVFILIRWFIFIKALGLTVTTFNVVRYFLVGLFGNLFLPTAIGGDLLKTVGLCRETSQKARVVASVLLDRLSGFTAVAIVATVAYAIGFRMIDDKTLIIPVTILGGALFLLCAVLFNEKIYSFGCRIFNPFPKIKQSLMNLHYDIKLLNHNRVEGFKAIGVSCVCQVTYSFVFYLMAKGLHQEIDLIYFLIFTPFLCVAASFPSIGGLGVREAGAAYLFAKIGVESGVAVSLSLINFLFMIVTGLIGGAFYVLTLSSGRVQCDPSNAGTDSKKA